MITLEVIVQNAEAAIRAEQLGAHRLELVSAISEGGLTPSYGTIKKVIEAVAIPVQVMIRPHSHSFVYSTGDWEVIKEDLLIMKEMGVSGVVFGCLQENGQIDEHLLENFLKLSDGMDVTFHRAIDETMNIQQAYHTLLKYSNSIKRILTSGGAPNVEKGLDQLKDLIATSKTTNGPVIMPGSGLNKSTIKKIHETLHATEYHFGSGVRVNGSFKEEIDPAIMRSLLNL